jgi:hypothetical protein
MPSNSFDSEKREKKKEDGTFDCKSPPRGRKAGQWWKMVKEKFSGNANNPPLLYLFSADEC